MNQNIDAFMRVLDAKDNSTGGGTASCVAGAMAAGLAAMVARLSMGKKELAALDERAALAALDAAKRAERRRAASLLLASA